MQLLSGARAVFFDLFDTLIQIDEARLPPLKVAGRRLRSTVPILYEDHVAERGIARERFVEALRDTMIEIGQEKKRNTDEVPALVRWQRVVARLEFEDGDGGEALAHTLTERHARTLAEAAIPVPRAREVLSAVRDRGLDVALISNFDHTPAADWILEGTGLADLIEKRVISEAVGVRKPDERIFREALDHFEHEPAACVHVGDQARADAWGAGQLGLRGVWINRHEEPYAEEGPPPALVISRLADLLQHF